MTKRMKNLSYRDEAGNHLGTLRPTPKALEELKCFIQI